MKKALISLSFDDGRADNVTVAKELLLPENVPATFNITTGYIDGSCSADRLMTGEPPMSVNDVKWLAENDLFEIALHGHEHLNTPDDIWKGYQELAKWLSLPEDTILGFASPNSAASRQEIEADFRLNQVIFYIRLGYRAHTYCPIRIFARKLGHLIHSPVLYGFAFRECLLKESEEREESERRCLPAVTVLGDATAEQVGFLLDECIAQKEAVILMFHSVRELAQKRSVWSAHADNWVWDIGKFRRLLRYLTDKRESGAAEIVTTQCLYERIGSSGSSQEAVSE